MFSNGIPCFHAWPKYLASYTLYLYEFWFMLISGNTNTNGGTSNPLCGDVYTIPMGQGTTINCQQAMMGRYLTINFRKHKEYLTLCEVEVYAKGIIILLKGN
jgi:hypothetical protein